jgi:hypothetical protein
MDTKLIDTRRNIHAWLGMNGLKAALLSDASLNTETAV